MALPTGQGAQMLAAIPQLLQLFTGSGKQTSSTTRSTARTSDPMAIDALKSVINAPATDTNKAVTNAIDMIFRQAMPSIGSAERGAGIYNYSGTKEAVNQVAGIAASKAAELELAQKNRETEQKTQAAGTLGQMTARDTATANATEKTGGTIDPLMAALTVGGLMLGNRVLKGFGDEGSNANAAGNIDFTPTVSKPDLGNIFDINFESMAGNMAEGLKSVTYDPMTGGQRTGGSEDFLSVLSDVASNSLLSGIGNFVSGMFGGSSGGESTSGGTVICTKMYELGYMDEDTYATDVLFGIIIKAFNPSLFTWYHSWAIPFVANWMHGNTLASKCVIQVMRPVVAAWSAYMKYQLVKIDKITKITKKSTLLGV